MARLNSSINKQIMLNGRQINYCLKRSWRARRLRLAINCDGALVVTQPRILSLGFVESFMREKADWITAKLDYWKKNSDTALLPKNQADYAALKKTADDLVNERLEYYNRFYDFKYSRISIRNQKTRWGSCSRRGNLSFNYRLALLPPDIADYVIVHELCHLREFNHSAKFWEQVARTLPDYARRRRALKGRFL